MIEKLKEYDDSIMRECFMLINKNKKLITLNKFKALFERGIKKGHIYININDNRELDTYIQGYVEYTPETNYPVFMLRHLASSLQLRKQVLEKLLSVILMQGVFIRYVLWRRKGRPLKVALLDWANKKYKIQVIREV